MTEEKESWVRAVYTHNHITQQQMFCLLYLADHEGPPPAWAIEEVSGLRNAGWLDDQLRPSWPPGLSPKEVNHETS